MAKRLSGEAIGQLCAEHALLFGFNAVFSGMAEGEYEWLVRVAEENGIIAGDLILDMLRWRRNYGQAAK